MSSTKTAAFFLVISHKEIILYRKKCFFGTMMLPVRWLFGLHKVVAGYMIAELARHNFLQDFL